MDADHETQMRTTLTSPLVVGLDHPEDVVWARDGALYAGGEDGQIYRIAADAGNPEWEQIAHRPGAFLLGLTSLPSGDLLVCDSTDAVLLRLDLATGQFTVWCEVASGTRLTAPNFSAVRPDGSVVLTDSGTWRSPDGSVVVVPADGGDGQRLDLGPMHYPNGCALLDPTNPESPIVVVESSLPGLTIVDASGRRILVELAGYIPDGVAVSTDGSLYVGCFQPNAILRIHPDSKSIDIVDEDWTGQRMFTPNNLTFYGADRRSLAVASVGGWGLGTLRTDVSGVALPGDPDIGAAEIR